MKVQVTVKNWLLKLNNSSGWLSKTVESHELNGTHTCKPTLVPYLPTSFRASFLLWDPMLGATEGLDLCCTSSNILPGVLSRVGEGCWAAVIREALILPGRKFPCHRVWGSWTRIVWPVPWPGTPLWERTCSLMCGTEGTEWSTLILVRASILRDLWLKERQCSASSPPEPSILSVVNN